MSQNLHGKLLASSFQLNWLQASELMSWPVVRHASVLPSIHVLVFSFNIFLMKFNKYVPAIVLFRILERIRFRQKL